MNRQVQKDPGDKHSGRGKKTQNAVVGPPGGISAGDPTNTFKTSEATVWEGRADDDADPTWEQRALCLLTSLQAEKIFKDLKPKIRDEVRALIEDAPDGARS